MCLSVYTAVFRFSDPKQYLVADASLQCDCQLLVPRCGCPLILVPGVRMQATVSHATFVPGRLAFPIHTMCCGYNVQVHHRRDAFIMREPLSDGDSAASGLICQSVEA